MRRRQSQSDSPSPDLPDEDVDLTTELLELKALHKQHRSRRKHITPVQAPTRPAQQRWKPNKEQLSILEEFYAQDTPPSHEHIKELANLIGQFGYVDESKVYYWFQNKKSREKRKRRKIEEEAAAAAAAASTAATSAGESSFSAACASAGESSAAATPSSSAAAAMHLEVSSAATASASVSSGSDHPRGHHSSSSSRAQIVIDGANFLETEATGLIDLATSFGHGAALFDPSTGRIIPTDEHGVTLEPLQPRAYNLVLPIPRSPAPREEPPPPPPPPLPSSSSQPPRSEGFSNLEDHGVELWDFSAWS